MLDRKCVVVAALLACAPCIASAQAVYTQRNISLNAAQTAATAALADCRSKGFKVSITVLDARGGTKLVMHDDGANPHTIENSMRKAYTSLTFRVPSGEYGKRVTSNPQQAGVLHLDRVTTLEGALPIFAGKDLIGSMGISGAPGGDKDAACVQVGLDHIAKELN